MCLSKNRLREKEGSFEFEIYRTRLKEYSLILCFLKTLVPLPRIEMRKIETVNTRQDIRLGVNVQ